MSIEVTPAAELGVSPSTPSFSVEPMEQWLRQVTEQGLQLPGAVAQAMCEDGYESSTAELLAALAAVRYGSAPLADALMCTPLQDAIWQMVRALPSARKSAMLPRTDHRPMAANCFGNMRRLNDGREIRLRACGMLPEFALLDGVLSDAECKGLIDLARANLQDSRIMAAANDGLDPYTRSCRDTTLHDVGASALLHAVEARVAELLDWPVHAMEPMQVICYRPGERFCSHWDYFDQPDTLLQQAELVRAGHRVATLLLYLNDTSSGGTTNFDIPHLNIVPQRGSALYFNYQLPDGSLDPASLHGGEVLNKGEKWVATLWLRERICRTSTT